MGTQEAVVTTTRGAVHETSVLSPEAVDHPGRVEATASRQMASARAQIIDADVDLHTMEDPPEEAQEALPAAAALLGLAAGTATSKDESGRNRTK